MEWKEEFSVGIPEIDAQHQTMFRCIALVEETVTKQQRWSAVHSALIQLSDFTRIHFAVEKSLMCIHGYPEVNRHVSEHQQFTAQLKRLQEKSLSMDVSGDMVAFIRKWLHEHIMTSDRHYAAYLPTAEVVTAVAIRYEATDSIAISTPLWRRFGHLSFWRGLWHQATRRKS